MLNSNFAPEKLPKNSKTAPFFGFAGTKRDNWYKECVKAHLMRIYKEQYCGPVYCTSMYRINLLVHPCWYKKLNAGTVCWYKAN